MLLALFAATFSPREAYCEQPRDSPEQRDARMKWWREARFGMFIHWGVFAVPAGIHHGTRVRGYSEWMVRTAKIPMAEYRSYANQFDPSKYDPDDWAQLAQDAGMKYIVITSKHHDGFALFPSDVTDWDVEDATPYGRDLIGPLAKATRERGLKFGTYFSQAQDWMHPGGAKAGTTPDNGWDPAQNGDFGQFLDKISVPQVRELLTRYQPDILWWDTPYSMTPEFSRKFLPLLAAHPRMITNNRLGGGVPGDTETPEQYVPATGFPDRDWETCMTMNNHFGYYSGDENYKSTEALLRHLIDIASKGGNFLLNIGPRADGSIPEPQIERLREIGLWLSKNGESIYGTSASPFPRYAFEGRATLKGNTLYVHVFEWPDDGAQVMGMSTPVKSASFLANDKPAAFTASVDNEGVPIVRLMPPDEPDPIATVVKLELAGPIEVQPYEVYVKQSADEAIVLDAVDAKIIGSRARLVQDRHASFIGFWAEPRDCVEWRFMAPAGRYCVSVSYATVDDRSGSEFVVEVEDNNLSGTVAGTGGWREFQTDTLGEIDLSAGRQTLTLKALSMANQSVMNLQRVSLTRVEQPAD